MKKLTLFAALLCAAVQLQAADWMTDVPKALAKAKTEKKKVLLHFTGSDWCPPCKALHANVLTTKEFEDYANKNFVLVELDFPRTKEQPAALKKANADLAKKYNLEGYPTSIVLDADGKASKPVIGYSGEKTKDYIGRLEHPEKEKN